MPIFNALQVVLEICILDLFVGLEQIDNKIHCGLSSCSEPIQLALDVGVECHHIQAICVDVGIHTGEFQSDI